MGRKSNAQKDAEKAAAEALAAANSAPAIANTVPAATSLANAEPAAVKTARVPDDAFFADLPEGYVPGRRADYLGDVIIDLLNLDSDSKKVIWLRHNTSPALTYLLRLAFCADVRWLIPAGVPPYKAWKGRRYSAPSELKRELRRLYLFIAGGNDGLSAEKRQKLFQQVIEGLERSELGLLVAIKDHTLEEDFGLSAELVNLAFPGILDAPFYPKFIK